MDLIDSVEKLYWEDRKSIREVADELEIGRGKLYSLMKEHGIPRRSSKEGLDIWRRSQPAGFRTHPRTGYEKCHTKIDGEQRTFPIHRLAAVAWCGYESVSGNVIHHKNNIPWDNREDNLRVMSDRDHKKLHAEDNVGGFHV